jgi:oxygen-dependent protoporphyrinogen oxidase
LPTKKRIVIVGAGISGLSLAFRLQERAPDAQITLLEQDQRPGGTAWTLREDGFQLEIGPNGFLDSKPGTVALCRSVGLGANLVEANPTTARKRFLFLGKKLQLLPTGVGALLWTDLLSWRGKLSFLLEPWRSTTPAARDESIAAFARRHAGQEVADVFADALVTGIYAGDPRLLSLPACFPRLAALERQYGSVIKGFAQEAKQRRRAAAARGEAYQRPGRLWSLRGGLRQLAEALAQRLKEPLRYGVCVRGIERLPEPASWTVRGSGNERWHADAVILTCPAYQQAAILADLDPALADEIAGIAYNRVAVVGLGYRRSAVPGSVAGFGFIAPQKTRRALLGVQWCSSIYPDRAPEHIVLLRAMCGGWHRADMVGWEDERLAGAVRAELRLAMGITAAPVFQKIIRWNRAIPQYHVGHLERLERIETRLTLQPGLFLGGNAYRGVALNDCTEQGELLADKIARFLAR